MHRIVSLLLALFLSLPLTGCLGGPSTGSPADQDDPPPAADVAGLARQLETLCREDAQAQLDAPRAEAMCRCLAENHQARLAAPQIALLIRDYQGLVTESERQSPDVEQLFAHDTDTAARCLADPAWRAP